ncbi:MAG: HAD-IA family hydrolase [Verrucomicrobiales bacterium]|nr:HAD-IA family hydrolase [Verrucomicrobiales bacterium]
MSQSKSHSPILAITFDAAGTLIHLAEPVGVSYARVAAEHGIESTPDDLGKAFGSVWKRTPLPFAHPNRATDTDEKSWWRRLVREVFEEAGATLPDEERFDTFFEALYLHFESPGTWLADPGAVSTLEQLSSRYRCIVLSNFDGRLRRILDDLGLLNFFETCLLSCELGASKPDPAVFRAAAKWLQLAPHQILHVGDDPLCDGEGARAAGFAHFRVEKGRNELGKILDVFHLHDPNS